MMRSPRLAGPRVLRGLCLLFLAGTNLPLHHHHHHHPLPYFSPDRDYHTVAVSTKGAAIGTDAVVLYKVFVDERGLLVAEQVGRFLDHKDLVWKLEWNVAGTVLSSSGEDGKVRLWKGACPEYPLCRQGESPLTFFLFRKK